VSHSVNPTNTSTRHKDANRGLSTAERKAVFSLSGIFALRMLGLFMILPVFALYAEKLTGSTPFLIGIAIGVYGLTQALLQIPFGMLSDRAGRKPMIIIGLIIFAGGSIVAASGTSIYTVIIGRALQGSGAIAAVIMALTADLTREEKRLSAMAIIGMSIGLSFALSLIAGPLLNRWIGVPGIFWLTAILSLLAILLVVFVVPTPRKTEFHRDTMPVLKQLKHVITDPQLVRLDVGIFVLHMMLTATFVVYPLVLRDNVHLAPDQHWLIYLPVMVLAIIAMIPFVVIAESKHKMKQVFGAAVLILAGAEAAYTLFLHSLTGLVFGLFIFFMAFNVLEATLPSLMAKMAMPDQKGTAMGVYSTSQFLGAFTGGGVGGWMYGHWGPGAVFLFCGLAAVVWFVLASTMSSPRYLSSYMIRVGEVDRNRARNLVAELTAVTGVAEAVVVAEDGIAYLKVDLHALDRDALQQYSVNVAEAEA